MHSKNTNTLIILDIDGVLLPANPNPDLPYMKRIEYCISLVTVSRAEWGYPPINKTLLPKDSLDLRETTDLGWLYRLLQKNHLPVYQTLDDPDRQEINLRAKDIITASVSYYFELMRNLETETKYELNPGALRFVQKAVEIGHVIVASGNPYRIAQDKILRSGLYDLIYGEANLGQDDFIRGYFLHGEDDWFREHLVYLAKHKFPNKRYIYVGDRISDLGMVLREKVDGIILPSFDVQTLPIEVKRKIQREGKVLLLENFSTPSRLEQAISFLREDRSSQLERPKKRVEFA
ncbi:MAG: hypothetical protein BroJett025_02000 [Patescibacteria group bacterium]|nr:MAG: hypothetical protein BroJett025_02000 [Patescibacteria group bacterium]